jgi:hypothetical protein
MVAIKRAIEPEIATPHGGSRAAPPPQLALEERKVETFHLGRLILCRRLFKLARVAAMAANAIIKFDRRRRGTFLAGQC